MSLFQRAVQRKMIGLWDNAVQDIDLKEESGYLLTENSQLSIEVMNQLHYNFGTHNSKRSNWLSNIKQLSLFVWNLCGKNRFVVVMDRTQDGMKQTSRQDLAPGLQRLRPGHVISPVFNPILNDLVLSLAMNE